MWHAPIQNASLIASIQVGHLWAGTKLVSIPILVCLSRQWCELVCVWRVCYFQWFVSLYVLAVLPVECIHLVHNCKTCLMCSNEILYGTARMSEYCICDNSELYLLQFLCFLVFLVYHSKYNNHNKNDEASCHPSCNRWSNNDHIIRSAGGRGSSRRSISSTDRSVGGRGSNRKSISCTNRRLNRRLDLWGWERRCTGRRGKEQSRRWRREKATAVFWGNTFIRFHRMAEKL